MKEAALRDDDDNVFDVSFAGQGEEGAGTLSATDIKVCFGGCVCVREGERGGVCVCEGERGGVCVSVCERGQQGDTGFTIAVCCTRMYIWACIHSVAWGQREEVSLCAPAGTTFVNPCCLHCSTTHSLHPPRIA
jgi:hypothetical protein